LKDGIKVDLDDTESAVLRALTRMSFRTATGAAAEAGVSRFAVGEILDQLVSKGLAEMTASPTTKRIRWAITPAGIAALNR
jgi:DNA-binding MarR family transcriptional regulator